MGCLSQRSQWLTYQNPFQLPVERDFYFFIPIIAPIRSLSIKYIVNPCNPINPKNNESNQPFKSLFLLLFFPCSVFFHGRRSNELLEISSKSQSGICMSLTRYKKLPWDMVSRNTWVFIWTMSTKFVKRITTKVSSLMATLQCERIDVEYSLNRHNLSAPLRACKKELDLETEDAGYWKGNYEDGQTACPSPEGP